MLISHTMQEPLSFVDNTVDLAVVWQLETP